MTKRKVKAKKIIERIQLRRLNQKERPLQRPLPRKTRKTRKKKRRVQRKKSCQKRMKLQSRDLRIRENEIAKLI